MTNTNELAFPIDSLLSARLFLSPQLSEGKIYFISDMGGAGMSLYSMDANGGIPQPLLPKGLALQNPYHMGGSDLFKVLPAHSQILVMIDQDGDENYQPHLIPLEGGIPKAMFPELSGQQFFCVDFDDERDLVYFTIDDRKTANREAIRVNLRTGQKISMGKSMFGNIFQCATKDLSKAVMVDGYGYADSTLYIWHEDSGERQLLIGVPLEERKSGAEFEKASYFDCHFISNEKELLCISSRFTDTRSIVKFPLNDPEDMKEVKVIGISHPEGIGELQDLHHVSERLYRLTYNIDGCSYVYEAELQKKDTDYILLVRRTICGISPLADGVLQAISEEIQENRPEYVFSFTNATTPPQIFRFGRKYPPGDYMQITNEQIVGIPSEYLSPGEDASYTSFDELRISARLYLPSPKLNYNGPRPLVVWVHGGPTSQEKPDFAWFSMPLIQTLTLNGFAVYVPNVRGSTGYGIDYMKKVERDWGGDDRKDHLEGLKMLEKDPRIDSTRRAVGGRSYGGFMTLTLTTRHPELWRAGFDMFGPYDLPAFFYRLPKTWQTSFKLILGDPDDEHDLKFLLERSPKTHLDQLQCPLLIIQGKNDPRVLEEESAEIVKVLREKGKVVDYLMFPDEGHDVLKFKNKVQCFTKIVEFLREHLS
ncbi:MAG: prolyl oligopeptidase family serine peptidase [Candidatus Thorarchaeota archaeon]